MASIHLARVPLQRQIFQQHIAAITIATATLSELSCSYKSKASSSLSLAGLPVARHALHRHLNNITKATQLRYVLYIIPSVIVTNENIEVCVVCRCYEAFLRLSSFATSGVNVHHIVGKNEWKALLTPRTISAAFFCFGYHDNIRH